MTTKQYTTKTQWAILTAGSLVGLVASFIQATERIEYAKNPKLLLSCDVNSVFSCSNVFDAWQSSVFGFSNSLMCIVFFSLILGVAVVGLTGGQLNKYLAYTMQFFSLFFLGFGAWYLQQSAFVINSLCVFCIFCYSGVIAINWAWLRINLSFLNPKSAFAIHTKSLISRGLDTFFGYYGQY